MGERDEVIERGALFKRLFFLQAITGEAVLAIEIERFSRENYLSAIDLFERRNFRLPLTTFGLRHRHPRPVTPHQDHRQQHRQHKDRCAQHHDLRL